MTSTVKGLRSGESNQGWLSTFPRGGVPERSLFSRVGTPANSGSTLLSPESPPLALQMRVRAPRLPFTAVAQKFVLGVSSSGSRIAQNYKLTPAV